MAWKKPLKIIRHIKINCFTHMDKIILKYRKSCKSWLLTLEKMRYFKAIFPGPWQKL